jgi:hypothetical protein
VESQGNEPWSAVDGCVGIHLTVVTGPDGRAAGRDVMWWLTNAPEAMAAGCALQDRRVVIPPRGFAESPLAELPAKEFATPIQWSPDGSALGWTDEEGLKVWQRFGALPAAVARVSRWPRCCPRRVLFVWSGFSVCYVHHSSHRHNAGASRCGSPIGRHRH